MLRRQGIRWQRAPRHHSLVCETLEAVYHEEIQYLLISMPPRYSKTQLVSNFVEWTLGKQPDSEYMYLSYTSTLATDKTNDILANVDSLEYQEIFPAVSLTSRTQGHWGTSAGGVVYSSGTSGTVTGFGAGKMRPGFGGALIVDDPHKPDEVFGPERDKVIKNYQRTVSNRLNWSTTPVIVIAHCLHVADLIAWLAAGKSGHKFHHLKLAALQDDGTALWPVKHQIEDLKTMERVSPYEFWSQFQQKPTPEGGAFFTAHNLFVYQPESSPPVFHPVDDPPVLECVYAVVDTANKAGSDHDGLAVVYWGRRPSSDEGCRLLVLDWDITSIDGAFLIDWIPNVFRRLTELTQQYPTLMGSLGAWVEDMNAGTILIQQGQNNNWPIHKIDSALCSLGKGGRAVNVSGYVHRGEAKITKAAKEKVCEYRGDVQNHFLTSVFGWSASTGDNEPDDLFDCFTYGVAIGMGNSEGF